jgi:hypothetical protein
MEAHQKEALIGVGRVKSPARRHRVSLTKAGRIICKLVVTVGSALLSVLLR